MLKKIFKSKKVKATKTTKVEKLDTKALGNVVGGGGNEVEPAKLEVPNLK
ncbi:MAG TPA: hypothetical protein VNX01_16735 [Bacteroidia bacterium]|jgi:hypothetical protein|nr:hypothetical protein [Bacteroidia bacterium]